MKLILRIPEVTCIIVCGVSVPLCFENAEINVNNNIILDGLFSPLAQSRKQLEG